VYFKPTGGPLAAGPDKTGRTKYTLARDEFIGKMQKLERKLDKQQRREDRFESMRY
jgi:hypothetical protein